MAEKYLELELLKQAGGCLGKAAWNEPLFILRGQDQLAPALVRAWAALAKEHGCSADKVAEAIDLAHKMEGWPVRKWPD
jgi:hypothetical protein